MTARTEFVEKHRDKFDDYERLYPPVPRPDERYGKTDLLSSAVSDYLLSLGLVQEGRNDLAP